MASWKIDATDEAPPEPTLLQKTWGRITGVWGWFVRLLILGFLVWLFFLGMSLLSEVKPESVPISYAEMEQEDRDAPVTQEDQELWSYMMRMVNGMNYGDFVLDNEAGKAEEFGRAYFPDSRAIVVTKVVLSHKDKTVDVWYDLGVNKQVHLIFSGGNITKYMTRYEGFSEGGSFLRYLQWYTYGKYKKGYPRYVCSLDLADGYAIGTPRVSKSVYKLEPFSQVKDVLDYFLHN